VLETTAKTHIRKEEKSLTRMQASLAGDQPRSIPRKASFRFGTIAMCSVRGLEPMGPGASCPRLVIRPNRTESIGPFALSSFAWLTRVSAREKSACRVERTSGDRRLGVGIWDFRRRVLFSERRTAVAVTRIGSPLCCGDTLRRRVRSRPVQ
jgi:hypothetical protein